MEMEQLTRWASLGRLFDPRLKNHRVVLGLSIFSGAIGLGYGLFVKEQSLIPAILFGINCAFSAFVSWVLSRELDPDHPNSGIIAPLLVLPAVLALGMPSLVAGFWAVMIFRVLDRSTGLPAKPLDSLGLVVLTIWVGVRLHPIALLLGCGALLLDSWLPEGHPYHRLLGAVVGLAAIGYIAVFGFEITFPTNLNLMVGVALASLFYAAAVLVQAKPVASCDFVDRQVSVKRVRAAQIAGLLVVVLFIVVLGQRGFVLQLPLWAAMIGLAGFEFAQRLGG